MTLYQTRILARMAAALAASLIFTAGTAMATPPCGCVGDINGDGFVNGADIGLILANWGSANESADLDGNGIVNGADLGLLLAKWGPCATPSNDHCGSATLVTDGDYPFCNTMADTDGPTVPCGDGNVFNDLWYAYAPTVSGTLTVSTCDSADFDTMIAVYGSTIQGVAACPGGIGFSTYLGCNDDGCGINSMTSKLSVPVTAGYIYKIRVGSWIGGWTGTGTLHVSLEAPGISCQDPIVLDNAVPNHFVINSNVGYPTTSLSPCNPGAASPTVWHSFTAPCNGWINAGTCDGQTDFDTVITVLHGANGGQCWDTEVTCDDDSQASATCLLNGLYRKSEVTFSVVQGQTYYILVSGYNGATGNYGLGVNLTCSP